MLPSKQEGPEQEVTKGEIREGCQIWQNTGCMLRECGAVKVLYIYKMRPARTGYTIEIWDVCTFAIVGDGQNTAVEHFDVA